MVTINKKTTVESVFAWLGQALIIFLCVNSYNKLNTIELKLASMEAKVMEHERRLDRIEGKLFAYTMMAQPFKHEEFITYSLTKK